MATSLSGQLACHKSTHYYTDFGNDPLSCWGGAHSLRWATCQLRANPIPDSHQRKQRPNVCCLFILLVPPETPVIYDDNGNAVKSLAGPYNEAGVLVLICEAAGGKLSQHLESFDSHFIEHFIWTTSGQPLPKVTWWRENRLLDATSENVVQGRVSNTLRIPNLSRSDLSMTLTCQASNNNMSVPTSAVAVIDMKRKPLTLLTYVHRVKGIAIYISSLHAKIT